jgi:hypothetical protein
MHRVEDICLLVNSRIRNLNQNLFFIFIFFLLIFYSIFFLLPPHSEIKIKNPLKAKTPQDKEIFQKAIS